MSRYETFDRSQLQLRSLEERGCDLWEPNVAEPASPQQPLDCSSLRQVALAIREARQNNKPVVVMIGGHPSLTQFKAPEHSRFLLADLEYRIPDAASQQAALQYDTIVIAN